MAEMPMREARHAPERRAAVRPARTLRRQHRRRLELRRPQAGTPARLSRYRLRLPDRLRPGLLQLACLQGEKNMIIDIQAGGWRFYLDLSQPKPKPDTPAEQAPTQLATPMQIRPGFYTWEQIRAASITDAKGVRS